MNQLKIGSGVFALAVGLTMVSTAVPAHAQASKQTYLPRYQGNTYVWNARHTRKMANLRHYQKTTLTASKRTKHAGKVYYYVHSKRNKVKGYVAASRLIAGKYYKGGYYRYPTKHILLSTERYSGKDDDQTGQSMYGQYNLTHLAPYMKQPSVSQMKTVLAFYKNAKKSTAQLPSNIAWKAKTGARVVMEYQWPTTNKADRYRFPMLERYNGSKPYCDWSTRENYWAAKDLAAEKGRAQTSYTYDESQYTVAFGGTAYNLADPRTQVVMSAGSGTIKHIYGGGYGPNHDLSLVDIQTHPRYVATANILHISATHPQLKHGLWLTTQTMTAKQRTSQLNAKQSPYYRQVDGSGFTQYHYTKGKWQRQFSVSIIVETAGKVNVTLAQAQVGNSPWGTAQTITTVGQDPTTLLSYLYKPTSFYTQASVK